MSTKFFNNIDATLLDKFHGIASAMANFDIFHTMVGHFRSSGFFLFFGKAHWPETDTIKTDFARFLLKI